MSKMPEAFHVDEFSLTSTSGHKHVKTSILDCILRNMGGLGRALVLNPCLCFLMKVRCGLRALSVASVNRDYNTSTARIQIHGEV